LRTCRIGSKHNVYKEQQKEFCCFHNLNERRIMSDG
jgi:hypothetical protein